jgi:phospholipase/carboxylesterase
MKPIETSLVHRVLLPEQRDTPRHPALILLHGRGADEEDLLGLAEVLDDRFLLLSPRAPYPFGYGGGFTWYDVGEVGTPEPEMFRDSYDRLSTFVADALAHYPIDPARVFLFGFSMGTVMSFALSLTQPSLFRGVVANSGYIPERTHLQLRWKDLERTEFLIIHGTLDPVIPVAMGRRSDELFRASNAPYRYREYPMAHQISDESLKEITTWLSQRLDQ